VVVVALHGVTASSSGDGGVVVVALHGVTASSSSGVGGVVVVALHGIIASSSGVGGVLCTDDVTDKARRQSPTQQRLGRQRHCPSITLHARSAHPASD